MRWANFAIMTLAVFGAVATMVVVGQEPESTPPVASAGTVAGGESDQARQLNTCREGILDAAARDVDRRRWSDLLIGYASAAANDLIVELLAPTQLPEVNRAVCEAIVGIARRNPSRLVPEFVDPLLELLGSEDAGLRQIVAQALAEFPRDGLPVRLAAIAGDEGADLRKRLAAIEALSKNTDRREVVRQLVALLDSTSDAVLTKVIASLEQASPDVRGQDVDYWRRWWVDREQLTDEQWLEAQLRLYRRHSRRVEADFEAYQSQSQAGMSATIAQMRSLQRELYRALPPEQRRAKLIEWLTSPLAVVKLTALGLIKSRIADEGQAPAGEVLTVLLKLLNDGNAEQRREVLRIVQNVNDPVVVDAVLNRLTVETHADMRLPVLSALGHMRDPRAIPALVAELQKELGRAAEVREAAISLGMIAERMDVKTPLDPAKEPLQRRFAASAEGDVAMRAAFLSAMAGVGDPTFAAAFAEAVESDDSRLLQPAILGLRSLGDRTKLSRLRDLTSNADPPVRLAAIAAVAELGRDAEDLQSLLTRLNPSIEPNALAREAAWGGFRDYMGRRPVSERIDAGKRLRDTPELESRYLSELADTLVATGADPLDLERVRDGLSRVLISQGRHGAAAAQLRLLFQQQVDREAETSGAVGIRWLEAALRAEPAVPVGEVISRIVADASGDASCANVIDAIARYADAPVVTADRTRNQVLLHELRGVSSDGWAPQWTALLQKIAARVEETPSQP